MSITIRIEMKLKVNNISVSYSLQSNYIIPWLFHKMEQQSKWMVSYKTVIKVKSKFNY